MLATVVTQSLGAAQVFFLVAVICAAIATVLTLLTSPPTIWAALVAGAITFVALGLLFFA